MEYTKEMIDKMPYKERMKHYDQELQAKLRTMSNEPLHKYDEVVRELCDKWRV